MRELLKRWDIGEIGTISPTSTGGGKTWIVTAAGGSFVLKVSDMARSEREYAALRRLSATQMPIAFPLATVDGSWHATRDGGDICCLYPKLPGRVIVDHFDGNAAERARGFGRAIALLHECFRQTGDARESPRMDLIEHVDEWALPIIRRAEPAVNSQAVERAWQKARSELEPIYCDLPQQLIHRDAHTSNMLFDGAELTGFLDFEMTRRGPRVFDVCYCASGILDEGFEDPSKAQDWLGLLRALINGYEEGSLLTIPEHAAVPGILVAIELLFIAYWVDVGYGDAAAKTTRLLRWLEAHRDSLMT